MKRRAFVGGALALLTLSACQRGSREIVSRSADPEVADPGKRDALSYSSLAVSDGVGPVDYAPLFEHGLYRCMSCGQPLFGSEEKYEAHTPWPSFWQALPGAVVPAFLPEEGRRSDTAVVCSACQARLGDVYPDEATPTGRRFCILSAALQFEPGGG